MQYLFNISCKPIWIENFDIKFTQLTCEKEKENLENMKSQKSQRKAKHEEKSNNNNSKTTKVMAYKLYEKKKRIGEKVQEQK